MYYKDEQVNTKARSLTLIIVTTELPPELLFRELRITESIWGS